MRPLRRAGRPGLLRTQRKAFLERVPVWQMWGDLGALMLSGFFFIPLGYAVFTWGERYAKRVGLLKRSG